MNLLPQEFQKNIRGELRARFLLMFSIVLFCAAALSALALAPAEVGLLFSSTPTVDTTQSSIDAKQDAAAVAHTKALLALVSTFTATSSLDDILAALSQEGPGTKIDNIAYSISGSTLTLAGRSATPDEVNTFRQNLESDLRFTQVSVPVSALLGSQNGDFTITMKVTQ
ncbi:MAG: hypothetical protein P4L81_01100 [Candidatus Pacebacteria bacterium]|nr:hypothetical protein [Candidatus Paceibacterota bacterium]